MSSGVPHQEFNPRAQQVIHDHSKWVNEWAGTFKPEPHVFGDLLGLVPSGSYSTEGDFATRQQAVDLADLSSSQFCRTHGGYCSVLKPVDFDCSGLPCEENSRANHKRKFMQGRFGDLYLVWGKYHRCMRTPLLILENTPEPCKGVSICLSVCLFHGSYFIYIVWISYFVFVFLGLEMILDLKTYLVQYFAPWNWPPGLNKKFGLRTSKFAKYLLFSDRSMRWFSSLSILSMPVMQALHGPGPTFCTTTNSGWSTSTMSVSCTTKSPLRFRNLWRPSPRITWFPPQNVGR